MENALVMMSWGDEERLHHHHHHHHQSSAGGGPQENHHMTPPSPPASAPDWLVFAPPTLFQDHEWPGVFRTTDAEEQDGAEPVQPAANQNPEADPLLELLLSRHTPSPANQTPDELCLPPEDLPLEELHIRAAPDPTSGRPALTPRPSEPNTLQPNSDVIEDVFLIGQERCVEDWPENSPELSPDWKPTGRLRLRRDSFQVTEAGEEKRSGPLTLGRKLKHSLLVRRSSKDKAADQAKATETRRGSKTSGDATEQIFSSQDADQQKPVGTSFSFSNAPDVDLLDPSQHTHIPPVQRRNSKVKGAELWSEGWTQEPRTQKMMSGDASVEPFLLGAARDKRQVKGDPMFDDDDDDEEGRETEGKVSAGPKRRRKLSIKFVPQRGYVIEMSKDVKEEAELRARGGPSGGVTPRQDLKVSVESRARGGCFPELEECEDVKMKSQSRGAAGVCVDQLDCRPKKPVKVKAPLFRRHSQAGERACPAVEQPPVLMVAPPSRRSSACVSVQEAELHKRSDTPPWEEFTPENKPQKNLKDVPEGPDPPGATSGDYYTQRDTRRSKECEEEEDGEDTDSLMEWWDKVEPWDEVSDNQPISSREEETLSFKQMAEKVHRGLRVFLKMFMERAELLYQHVMILYSIADDIGNSHHRSKIASLTGGTTTAVGGAAAIAGLALIPVTFGASIIVSAIGLGVATAGGITAASATISDNINKMHDRKKIEVITGEYAAQLLEMRRGLLFVSEGLYRLRGHALLRRNNYYTGDWEVRRALQTLSCASGPVERAEEVTGATLTRLSGLNTGIDRYFTSDARDVRRGCRKEASAEVRGLAKQLHEGLTELDTIRETLLDAVGNI